MLMSKALVWCSFVGARLESQMHLVAVFVVASISCVLGSLCFVRHYFVSSLLLQSSRGGREIWLFYFICALAVIWLWCFCFFLTVPCVGLWSVFRSL